jgi:hypothetical protein
MGLLGSLVGAVWGAVRFVRDLMRDIEKGD